MNADIAYIMSCSDDEFQQVTGIRLPEDAWDRWSDDMDKRTDELLALFEKAVAAERERCEALIASMANLLELQQKREGVVIDMIASGIAAEREACAKVCEEPTEQTYEVTTSWDGFESTRQMRMPKTDRDCAAAIRARSST